MTLGKSLKLTSRQAQIAEMVFWEWSDATIAENLGVSQRSVKRNVKGIKSRLEVQSRIGIALAWERARQKAVGPKVTHDRATVPTEALV